MTETRLQPRDRRLLVDVASQRLTLEVGGVEVRIWPVSTSKFGLGSEEGSFCTPTGRFRIAACIGAGQARGTIFKGRVPVGRWEKGTQGGDPVLTRILWLEGVDPDNANTKERYIYIHGTHEEELLGRPASHGCVRMANADVEELFDQVAEGDEVVIG